MLAKIGYSLTPAKSEDLLSLAQLESDSFAEDEAASQDTIHLRMKDAGGFFKVLKHDSDKYKILGFVNGTCASSPLITHESMSSHNHLGHNLVIHSVTIDNSIRRQGFGNTMLKEYVSLVAKESKQIHRLQLLSKAYLIPLYVSCGFHVVGLSSVVHGQEQWFEMHLDLNAYRHVRQIIVDSFADKPFSGNPAAVVFEHRDVEWMQNVAMENNYAETAFLSKVPNVDFSYNLRWFTPSSEVDLCGHATLAAAHALYETKRVSNRLQKLYFHTQKSGVLSAVGKEDGTIELNFPVNSAHTVIDFTSEQFETLCTGLRVTKDDILYLGRSSFDLFVELHPTVFATKLTNINHTALAALGGRGVIVTCLGGAHTGDSSIPLDSVCKNKEFDFVSRFFGPNVGIPEDPVTGSAHCTLAPFWFNKIHPNGTAPPGTVLKGYQASQRGGVVHVAMSEGVGDRVLISGPAVTTMHAKILV